MKQIFSKTTTIAFVILFIVSMATSMTLLVPTASAHQPPITVPTYAFINAAPNPIGVGQKTTIVFWLDKVPIGAEGKWGDRWHNMKVTVTTPDGTNTTLGTFDSDANGGASTSYTPTAVGNYTVYFEFPGQTEPAQVSQLSNPFPYTSGFDLGYNFLNDTFAASSTKTSLTVQQEPVTSTTYGSAPLPTNYWTRPINSMNRDWATIGGNWLGIGATAFGITGMYDYTGGGTSSGGNFDPYSTAPKSAHVMWTLPIAFGGQAGGVLGTGDQGLYATGTAYEAKFGAVIINGVLYYTEYPGAGINPTGLKAVNLRTGATIWEKPITDPLRLGMVNNFVTGDQYGAHAYLFTTTGVEGFGSPKTLTGPTNWTMYDAMTGAYILKITGVSAGALEQGPNGEIMSYTVNGTTTSRSLTIWNSTVCISNGAQANENYRAYSSNEVWSPPPGVEIPWSGGYQSSTPITTTIGGNTINPGLGIYRVENGTILMTATMTADNPPGMSHGGSWRVDAAYKTNGQLLWGPINRTITAYTTTMLSMGQGRYAEYTQQFKSWIVYDLNTGIQLFTTQPKESDWAYYDYTAPAVFGYGTFYTWGIDGTVYAYDSTTGALKWTWYAGNAGTDTPYGSWPLGTWSSHHILADGILYVRSGHDYTPPVFRGAQLYAINATSGQLLWSDLSFDIVSSPALADGIMVWFNGYDNQIYAYGQGPTATTINAPLAGVEEGKSIMITGTVLDISAGTQQEAVKANHPYGVAAVSDSSQRQWMDYLYQQQEMPNNVTGVPVTLSVIDSNGNYRTIGNTYTDTSGTYRFAWKPDITGNYTLMANFEGSNAYYPSSAETGFVADSAPTTAPTNTIAPTSMVDTYFAPAVIGIILAIIIVGAATILVLQRKRP